MGTSKGITPVIAIVLLIPIVITGVYTVYSTVEGTQSQITNSKPTLPISSDSVSFESCWGTPNDPNYSIRNTGDEAINVSEIPVRVNTTYLDMPADYTVSPSIVDPQSTFILDISSGQTFNAETELSLILSQETVSYNCRNLN